MARAQVSLPPAHQTLLGQAFLVTLVLLLLLARLSHLSSAVPRPQLAAAPAFSAAVTAPHSRLAVPPPELLLPRPRPSLRSPLVGRQLQLARRPQVPPAVSRCSATSLQPSSLPARLQRRALLVEVRTVLLSLLVICLVLWGVHLLAVLSQVRPLLRPARPLQRKLRTVGVCSTREAQRATNLLSALVAMPRPRSRRSLRTRRSQREPAFSEMRALLPATSRRHPST